MSAYGRFVRFAGKCHALAASYWVFSICAVAGLAANMHIVAYAAVNGLVSEGARQLVLCTIAAISLGIVLAMSGCALAVIWRSEDEVRSVPRAVLLSLLFVTFMQGAFLGLALLI